MSSSSPFSYVERMIVDGSSIRIETDAQSLGITPISSSIQTFEKMNLKELSIQFGSSNAGGKPKGVFIKAVFTKSTSQANFENLLQFLVDHRFVTASVAVLPRLHRVVWHNEEHTAFELLLPFEGAAVSVEGMEGFIKAFSPCRGVFHSIGSDTLSSLLLGTFRQMSSRQRRSFWIHYLNNKQNGTSISKGIQFGLVPQTKLSQVLPSTLDSSCPIADSSELHIVADRNEITIQPLSQWKNVVIEHHKKWEEQPLLYSTIWRPRGVSNSGTLQTTLRMDDHNCSIATLFWTVPISIVTPVWHSLSVRGGALENGHCRSSASDVKYIAEFLQNGSELKFTLESPPPCITVSMDYKPKFLAFQDFPGDPNRGMEVVLGRAQLCDSSDFIYSNELLLMAVVPDMSMPFNVISLSCTLWAFLLGTMLNLLLRKSSKKVSDAYFEREPEKTKLQKVRDKLKEKFGKLLRKKAIQTKEDTTTEEVVETPAPTEQAETETKHDEGEATKSE